MIGWLTDRLSDWIAAHSLTLLQMDGFINPVCQSASLPTMSAYKTQLKTVLFRQAFSQSSVDHSCKHRLQLYVYVFVR